MSCLKRGLWAAAENASPRRFQQRLCRRRAPLRVDATLVHCASEMAPLRAALLAAFNLLFLGLLIAAVWVAPFTHPPLLAHRREDASQPRTSGCLEKLAFARQGLRAVDSEAAQRPFFSSNLEFLHQKSAPPAEERGAASSWSEEALFNKRRKEQARVFAACFAAAALEALRCLNARVEDLVEAFPHPGLFELWNSALRWKRQISQSAQALRGALTDRLRRLYTRAASLGPVRRLRLWASRIQNGLLKVGEFLVRSEWLEWSRRSTLLLPSGPLLLPPALNPALFRANALLSFFASRAAGSSSRGRGKVSPKSLPAEATASGALASLLLLRLFLVALCFAAFLFLSSAVRAAARAAAAASEPSGAFHDKSGKKELRSGKSGASLEVFVGCLSPLVASALPLVLLHSTGADAAASLSASIVCCSFAWFVRAFAVELKAKKTFLADTAREKLFPETGAAAERASSLHRRRVETDEKRGDEAEGAVEAVFPFQKKRPSAQTCNSGVEGAAVHSRGKRPSRPQASRLSVGVEGQKRLCAEFAEKTSGPESSQAEASGSAARHLLKKDGEISSLCLEWRVNAFAALAATAFAASVFDATLLAVHLAFALCLLASQPGPRSKGLGLTRLFLTGVSFAAVAALCWFWGWTLEALLLCVVSSEEGRDSLSSCTYDALAHRAVGARQAATEFLFSGEEGRPFLVSVGDIWSAERGWQLASRWLHRAGAAATDTGGALFDALGLLLSLAALPFVRFFWRGVSRARTKLRRRAFGRRAREQRARAVVGDSGDLEGAPADLSKRERRRKASESEETPWGLSARLAAPCVLGQWLLFLLRSEETLLPGEGAVSAPAGKRLALPLALPVAFALAALAGNAAHAAFLQAKRILFAPDDERPLAAAAASLSTEESVFVKSFSFKGGAARFMRRLSAATAEWRPRPLLFAETAPSQRLRRASSCAASPAEGMRLSLGLQRLLQATRRQRQVASRALSPSFLLAAASLFLLALVLGAALASSLARTFSAGLDAAGAQAVHSLQEILLLHKAFQRGQWGAAQGQQNGDRAEEAETRVWEIDGQASVFHRLYESALYPDAEEQGAVRVDPLIYDLRLVLAVAGFGGRWATEASRKAAASPRSLPALIEATASPLVSVRLAKTSSDEGAAYAALSCSREKFKGRTHFFVKRKRADANGRDAGCAVSLDAELLDSSTEFLVWELRKSCRVSLDSQPLEERWRSGAFDFLVTRQPPHVVQNFSKETQHDTAAPNAQQQQSAAASDPQVSYCLLFSSAGVADVQTPFAWIRRASDRLQLKTKRVANYALATLAAFVQKVAPLKSRLPLESLLLLDSDSATSSSNPRWKAKRFSAAARVAAPESLLTVRTAPKAFVFLKLNQTAPPSKAALRGRRRRDHQNADAEVAMPEAPSRRSPGGAAAKTSTKTTAGDAQRGETFQQQRQWKVPSAL